MNEMLQEMVSSGDIKSHRTMLYHITDIPVAYVSEYIMDSNLGPFTWYLTYIYSLGTDRELAEHADIVKYIARAKLFMPAFLERRFPPENREDIESYLAEKGLKEYNKFDILNKTRGKAFAMIGNVHEVAPKHCRYNDIFCIDQIYKVWKEVL